ncbi:elongation factor G [Rhodopirellula sallentina]|uniref:Elongation factor G n=1 Tax=Rhodopirellula sallentina SM41 TaxID=1263870 RepID=M5UHA4_9BACT|nr:elongation factor G [Rhodopirellula sallentina]EMI57206.1 translation elongation factor 2 (EF-2/EF-G) [Rhodopirellula sallentina SM41]
MPIPTPDSIRNLCLCGQTGSGKTTLVERLLFESGEISRQGNVQDGNTVSDFAEEEQRHRHSLQPSIVHFDHEGHHVNVIDTPGMSDFIGHAIACFPAVESVVVMVDASRGIESETRRLMRVAAERKLPRMFLINKIDTPEVDLEKLVDDIKTTFGDICLPINMPTPGCDDVIDVFETDAHDTTAFSSAEKAHTQIVEQVVEVDDQLTENYLEAGAEKLDAEQIHAAFEKALREGHLVPIVFASATNGTGIKHLLHVTASLLPSPLEGNPRPFVRGDEPLPTEFDPDKPTIAHIFRVATDPHIGKLGIFRVHQGCVRSRSELYIDDLRKPLRIGHVMRLQGKDHKETDVIGPGEIGAVSKIDDVHFDGVLHDEATTENPPHLVPLALPKPMYGLAIELKRHADETKFSAAVQKLQSEDPCFRVERIAATNETVMRGLGDLHLRVILEKLQSQYGIELETAPPKIAYKETITAPAEAHYRHKKQTGGSGQFGEVYLRIAPLPQDHPTGFEFENKTVGGSIPRQFMPAIEKGVRQVLEEGAIAGYPMSGVRVEVFDGKHHEVDSKEIAFITAGRKAFIEAVKKSRPVLLEPFVDIEVSIPSQYMGDITGDLSVKRGRVSDTQMLSDTCVIRATAPLSELQNYATDLKSITAGSGAFTLSYSHDEQAPPAVQQEIIASYQPEEMAV